jgi:hypothetical protein
MTGSDRRERLADRWRTKPFARPKHRRMRRPLRHRAWKAPRIGRLAEE